MKGISIVSTGYYVPSRRVENEVFSKTLKTSDEWITSHTSIKARHFVEDETTTTLAYRAALKAIEGIDKDEIGIVIVASMTNDYLTPSTACLLQKALGLQEDIIAFDLSAACSGFEYALSVTRALLYANKKRYGLIVGAECLSSILDFKDRSTCVLFGDGAGAAVVEKADKLYLDLSGARGNQEALYVSRNEQFLHMQGRDVFRFATTVILTSIERLLNEAKLSVDDIDYFVLHQANGRIISHVYKKLDCPAAKFYMNLDEYGNTSAASIPLALAEMNEKKMLKRGMKIILVGFGGGLTYGANLLEW